MSRSGAQDAGLCRTSHLPCLGVHEQVGLDRFAIGGAPGSCPAGRWSPSSLASPSRILSRSACTVSGLAMIFCSSITSLRMNMFSQAAPQCRSALPLELGHLHRRLSAPAALTGAKLVGMMMAFRLLGAALQRLDARGRGQPDQQLGLHALALHLLQHAAGGERMRRDGDDVGVAPSWPRAPGWRSWCRRAATWTRPAPAKPSLAATPS